MLHFSISIDAFERVIINSSNLWLHVAIEIGTQNDMSFENVQKIINDSILIFDLSLEFIYEHNLCISIQTFIYSHRIDRYRLEYLKMKSMEKTE